MVKYYTQGGTRFGRFQTAGSRWDPHGKVHIYVYRKDVKRWVIQCRFSDYDPLPFHGAPMDDPKAEVTCRRCAGVIP
jgi:hypothetical protein